MTQLTDKLREQNEELELLGSMVRAERATPTKANRQCTDEQLEITHKCLDECITLSSAPLTYRMSKDYDQLYDRLKAGGEALGVVPHKINDGRSGALIIRHGEWAITIGNAISGGAVLPIANDGIATERDALKAECERLSLEWLAPEVVIGDEEIERTEKPTDL